MAFLLVVTARLKVELNLQTISYKHHSVHQFATMKRSFISGIISCCILFSCTPEHQQPPSTLPITLKDTTIRNIAYGSHASQQLDLGLPANRTNATLLVIVIHGGGWNSGDKNELSFMVDGMKKRGFAVANINYRLSPQGTDNYNMQLDDIHAAIEFLASKAAAYTFGTQKYYVVGHSAGGHLALSYAYTRNTDKKIKAAGSMAGPTNLYNLAYYNAVLYEPVLSPFLGMNFYPITAKSEALYKNASPYFQAASTSVPTILFHGDADLVVSNEQSAMLANKLTELKVDNRYIYYAPFTGHDWWADYAKRDNTMDELKTWFNDHP